MASILKIDGYSLVEYLRVAADDGLDPVDADRLEPQFGEAAGGDGDPFISLREGNAEHVWPLHLTPLKSSSFADTTDGLHALVTDLNLRLAAAAAVEWRMDGATASTFHDVQHARFEPAFDYRKAGKLWVSGILRVWARPYGTTGTSRIAATAAASGLVTIAPATTIQGDTPAQVAVTLSGILASALPGGTTASLILAGVAVVPTSVSMLVPPASMTVATVWAPGGAWPGPSLIAASGAIASQAWRLNGVHSSSAVDPRVRFALRLPPAPAGRNRMLLLARFWGNPENSGGTGMLVMGQRPVLQPNSLDEDGQSAKWYRTASPAVADTNWKVFDLGVTSVATDPFDLAVPPAMLARILDEDAAATAVAIGGVLMVPEERAAIVAEPAGTHPVSTFMLNEPDGVIGRFAGATSAITLADRRDAQLRGNVPRLPVGTGYKTAAFVLPDGGAHNVPVQVEIRVRERFTFAR